MPVGSRIRASLDVASSIALIAAAGVLVWTLFFKPQPIPTSRRNQVERVENLRIEPNRLKHQMGDAPVAIVEFSDFQCPFCLKHATDTLPSIKEKLVESGRARYVAVHYPIESIHPYAFDAALGAECAGRQGRFWEMHQQLFANSKALSRADLVTHAKALNLDAIAFDGCLKDATVEELVRADQSEGARLGVNGTPAFFIGIVRPDGAIDLRTRINGAVSFQVFADAIEEAASSQLGKAE